MQETEGAGRVGPEAGGPAAGRLFPAFLRLGSAAFGGPAMVAYIGSMAVEKKQWLTKESFEAGVALCQSIPGATAMQAAAYVGLRAGGPRGALAAFVGFGLPAFALMVVLAAVYRRTRDLGPVVAAALGLLLYRGVASPEAEWPAEAADGPRGPLRFAAGRSCAWRRAWRRCSSWIGCCLRWRS
jgi:chromate transporter